MHTHTGIQHADGLIRRFPDIRIWQHGNMTCSLHITYSLLKSEDLKKLLIKVLRITLPYIVGYKAQVNQIPSIYIGFTFSYFSGAQ